VAIKTGSSWYSDRIGQEIALVRWGHWGTPVLLFPTAGGDAEEAERMGTVGALWPLIEAGRIKVYSVDSIAGRALAAKWGSEEHRSWLLNRYQDAIAYEIVPAIHADCGGPMEVVAAGASIGAFKAVAVTCRYPWLFRAALAMSATFDLEALLGFRGNAEFYFASPLHFLPNLGEGHQLDLLRRRFVLMAFGQGRWESPDESWRMAGMLGAKGVPNRVDAWGQEWDHDWPTWRAMLPRYVEELA
jgi:esterase/lipase superfamily enzyme